MIVVLDTNVLVSGFFFHGPPADIVEAWFEGRFEVYATPKILEEYIRVLEEIRTLKVPRFEHHVDCAIRSNARYLVSGDKDLKSFRGSQGLEVVSPRQFLGLLK